MTKNKSLPEIECCPFCGNPKPTIWFSDNIYTDNVYTIHCDSHKCRGVNGPQRKTKRGAIEAWNRA